MLTNSRQGHISGHKLMARVFCLALLPVAIMISQVSQATEANPQVRLQTSAGSIIIELDPALAPESVENFLTYVDDGFYDGTIFHRVIPGFMIQGGGFTEAYQRKQTRSPINNEANNGLKNLRYTLAMARTSAPHSATAQFFINTTDNDFLDHSAPTPRGWGYAVFGRVVEGFDVVDTISDTPTGAKGPFRQDAPLTEVVIISAARSGADDEQPDQQQPAAESETESDATTTDKSTD